MFHTWCRFCYGGQRCKCFVGYYMSGGECVMWPEARTSKTGSSSVSDCDILCGLPDSSHTDEHSKVVSIYAYSYMQCRGWECWVIVLVFVFLVWYTLCMRSYLHLHGRTCMHIPVISVWDHSHSFFHAARYMKLGSKRAIYHTPPPTCCSLCRLSFSLTNNNNWNYH